MSDTRLMAIAEVADKQIGVGTHTLRFWETKFKQIEPVRRPGGRRLYRPEDIALLRGIYVLLYQEGYTIRGVQKLIADHGVQHVRDAGKVVGVSI